MAKNKKKTPVKKHKVPFEQVMRTTLFSLAFLFILRELLSVGAEAVLLESGWSGTEAVGLFYLLRAAASLLIALPAYLLVSKIKRQEVLSYYKPRGVGGKKLGGGLALLGTAALLPALGASLYTGLSQGFDTAFSASAMPVWQAMLYSVIAMPLMEELVFRGVVLHRLKPYGAKRAILITAGLFAIGHGSLGNILLGILPGLVLSAAVYFGVSVGAATLMHMAVNLLGNALLPWALHLGGAAMWGMIALVVLISAAGGYVLLKRKDFFGELDFDDA